MPSRSSHSRRRTPTKKHKKSHKRSRKSSDDGSPSSSNRSIKKDEITNGKDGYSFYTLPPTSTVLSPSLPVKLEAKEEKVVETSPADQLSTNLTISNTQITKKRKSRWLDEKVLLPHMPTSISATSMTDDQQKIYILQLQIVDLTRRLKMNTLDIPPDPINSAIKTHEIRTEMSPSPEPIYDQQGKRQNTREVRARRKLEDHRRQLITELLVLQPDYKPPGDYKPQQTKYDDKVMLPQEDYPEINFIGLIIGPRGTTLKMLEKETNARIIIRGKGCQRDGKMGLVKFASMPGEDEPLHAYITGISPEVVAKAVEKVKEILNKSIDEPDGLNELRKQQLRQLALLNGTLRENNSLIQLKLMDEAEKILTNTIICTVCGGAGHISTDCKFRKRADGTFVDPNVDGSYLIHGNQQERQKLDCEYQSLMNELTGKKGTNTNALSLDDQRALMNGSRLNGTTLAIAGGPTASLTDSKETGKTIGAVSFNSNGSMNIDSDHNPPSLMSLNTNNSNHLSNQHSSHSHTSFPSTSHRYSNHDVFDGYHLLRRPNRNNYSSYIEGDSYRAQHIPALIENQDNNMSATSWSNSRQQQQQYNHPHHQWNQYSNPHWNNAPMYHPHAYQQQYYHNNHTGFTPPLPAAAPPPPPPPPPF